MEVTDGASYVFSQSVLDCRLIKDFLLLEMLIGALKWSYLTEEFLYLYAFQTCVDSHFL